MKHLRVLLLALILVALAVGGLVLSGTRRGAGLDAQVQAQNRENTARRRSELLATGAYRAEGWRPMEEARPGEWLFEHPEGGQTWDEFVRSDPLQKKAGRERIVLQPYDPLRPEARGALEKIRAHCALFFQAETVIGEGRPIPDSAWRAERKQHDAAQLLVELSAVRPEGAWVYAGVCDKDLWVAGLDNYVFGLGRFREGLGVYSLTRFHYPGIDARLYLRRSLALLAHEIGHGLGLYHCIYWRCVMNGANSLPESDGAPLEPCPLCLRKLQKACGFDVRKRWEGLAAFFDGEGMSDEAAWVRARLTDLEKLGPLY